MGRIFTFALAALLATFLWVLLASPMAHAADASWNNDNVVYSGQTFTKQTADGTRPPTLSKGTTYYRNMGNVDGNGNSTIGVIYFSGNPTSATSGTYFTFQLNSSAQPSGKSADKKITIGTQVTIPTGTASWSGVDILYDGHTYTGKDGGPRISTGSNPDLTSGMKYYQYNEAPNGNGVSTIHVLYFDASTDPTTATSVDYKTYTLDANLQWSNPSAIRTVSILTVVKSPSSTDGQTSESTCKIDGIGWIVCPVSNFLAKGMDSIFDVLKGFLVVTPLTTNTGSLYKAWSVMRNFANVAFVIAFIVIIYSQLTGLGISNYGIKKLLPRLIISAVLVNVSYWVCAIAVDLSNITGSSLQGLLVSLRDQLNGPNTNSLGSWQSITGFLLAGGTAAAATMVGGGILVVTVGASLPAAIILLLPLLLTVLLAALVALIVLAARQAVIVLLIIVAPLAFVAYLLPNTEKWFDKWKDTFVTLLIFFPLFALIFGGSQLASFLIIQTSHDINIILLGMFIQVAPLVVTPLLIKFSGSVVSRIAGVVNNPNKGFIDRAKKWSRDQSELMAARNMGRGDPVRRRQVFRRFALGMDEMRRGQDDQKAAYTAQSDARWAGTQAYSDINQIAREASERKHINESHSEVRFENAKNVHGVLHDMEIEARDVKLQLENAKATGDIHWEQNHDPLIIERKLEARTSADTLARLKATDDASYEEFKAGHLGAHPATANVARMLHQNQHDVEDTAIQAMRSASAKRVQQENLTTAIAADMDQNSTVAARQYAQLIRRTAGGIQGHDGAQRALAQALSDQNRARQDTITNADAIIQHSNLSAEETLRIAENISVKNITVTDDIREAAIKRVGANGVMPHIDELLTNLDMSPTGNENFRKAFVESMRGNSGRQKYIGYGLLDQMTQGIPGGVNQATVDSWVEKMLTDGKLSARELSSQDRDTLVRINEAIARLPRNPALNSALGALRTEIGDLRGNAQLWNATGERKDVIETMERII